MEQKFSSLGVMEAANHSKNSAMEAENHVKQGASSKVHTSRKMDVHIKRCLASLALVFVTSLAFAQSELQDVVYLKSGSIIRGVIIEQVPNQSIKIETADRNVFVYQMEEIEKLAKEPYRGRGGRGLQSGYKGIVEAGFAFGIGEFGMNRFKLDFINAYQINPYFSLGLGIGARNYYDLNAPVLVPIFADFRANFIDNLTSPYLSLGVGYSFDATNSFESMGFYLNPTLGVTIMIHRNHSINVGVGYEMQRLNFFVTDWRNYTVLTKNSGAISLVLSLAF